MQKNLTDNPKRTTPGDVKVETSQAFRDIVRALTALDSKALEDVKTLNSRGRINRKSNDLKGK